MSGGWEARCQGSGYGSGWKCSKSFQPTPKELLQNPLEVTQLPSPEGEKKVVSLLTQRCGADRLPPCWWLVEGGWLAVGWRWLKVVEGQRGRRLSVSCCIIRFVTFLHSAFRSWLLCVVAVPDPGACLAFPQEASRSSLAALFLPLIIFLSIHMAGLTLWERERDSHIDGIWTLPGRNMQHEQSEMEMEIYSSRTLSIFVLFSLFKNNHFWAICSTSIGSKGRQCLMILMLS